MDSKSQLVFRIDEKLLQVRPPRLTVAATLNALCKQVESGQLDVNFVVEILDENRIIPYLLCQSKSLLDISLGKHTNASKVGDLIVSEECIRGTYELCISFLEFVLSTIKNPQYRDTSKTMLASLTYICNEIYPSHNIWTFQEIEDMDRILCLCTEIFHEIVSKAKEPTSDENFSDLETICIISLSQNQAHKQLLDVIVGGKNTIKKKIDKLGLTDEKSFKDTSIITCVRQSLFIFSKLLSYSKYIKDYCDADKPSHSSSSSSGHYQHGASSSSAPMTNLEKALFDTNIRPGLLQHLFSFIYEKQDSSTACLAVDLIKNIAKKFSMSLMACLGSEADRVCEFFFDCLGGKEPNIDLEVAILDLLSTCVKHQPGLLELFLNFKRESKNGKNDEKKEPESKDISATRTPESLEVVMKLLNECIDKQDDSQKLLHTYVMKFILTFWQKLHSAVDQFDKAAEFWDSVTDPLVKFLDSDSSVVSTSKTYGPAQALDDRLISYALMILAREIYMLNSGVSERKINSKLSNRLSEMSKKNLLGKYSLSIKKKYEKISTNLDKAGDYNRLLVGWRDFLISYAKYTPFEVSKEVRQQVVGDVMTFMRIELRLGEAIDKERIAAIGDTLLLIWTKWMEKNACGDGVFASIHELIYLVDSCRDYLPFSFLLTFQSTLNIYLMRQSDYLGKSGKSFDLIVSAVRLMQFALKIMEKYLNEQLRNSQEYNYKPSIESRLCQASIMSLRFIIDVSRRDVSLWLSFIQTNLCPDYLVQFLTLLMNRRAGAEICFSMIELLLCLSSIRETADYLNKTALIDNVNMVAISAYERPYAHLSQLAAPSIQQPSTTNNVNSGTLKSNHNGATGASTTNKLHQSSSSSTSILNQVENSNLLANYQSTPMEVTGPGSGSNGTAAAVTATNNQTISDTTKIYLDNVNSDHKWLPIFCHVIRLNISMMLTLSNEYMSKAIEFLSIHCIRICELIELLRTRPRSVNMEEALQMIYMIDLVLRNGRMWLKRNSQSYNAISEEIGKTAYTLATSALPPPTAASGLASDDPSQENQNYTIKPRDCLVYARCCYNFGKFTEAERVLFQTKFGDKIGFIKEASQIYGKELSIYAFHLAAQICLKTSRQSDSIDFALQVFSGDAKYSDIVRALESRG